MLTNHQGSNSVEYIVILAIIVATVLSVMSSVASALALDLRNINVKIGS